MTRASFGGMGEEVVDVEFGPDVDTFEGADGEANARRFGTFGYPIRAHRA